MRNTLLAVSVIVLPLCCRATAQDTTPDDAASRRPNIIIIFIDDMGYADIGPFGAQGYATPNLDRMAEEGRIFTDFPRRHGRMFRQPRGAVDRLLSRAGQHTRGSEADVKERHPEIVKRLSKAVEAARVDLGDSLTKRKGKNIRPHNVLEPGDKRLSY